MRSINKTVQVPFTASQMYDLINGLESYPDYLPWCKNITIQTRTIDEIVATIHFSKGGISHSFTTRNFMQPNRQIEVFLVEGPFRHLKGLWRFEDLSKSESRVSFDMEFELANRLLDMAFGPVLEGIANTFVEAFSQRAHDVYNSNKK